MELILITLIGSVCLVWLAYASAQRVEFGAALLLFISYVISPLRFSYEPYAIFSVGSIILYERDLLVIILFLALVFRFFSYKTIKNVFPLQRNLLVVFVVLVGFSMLLGAIKYGQGGFVDARQYLEVIAALLYFVSFKYTDRKLVNLAKIFIVAGTLISIIGFVNWVMWQGQFVNAAPDLAYLDIRGAIGVGPSGMIIVIAWLLLVVAKIHGLLKRNIINNFLLLFFLLMLVLLQERTLWVITGIYLIYFFLQYNIRFLPYVTFATLAIAVLGFFLYAFDLLHIRQTLFGMYLALITTQGISSTFVDRYGGWIELLKNLPWESYFFGLPFGSGYERIVRDRLLTFSPHNFYVTHILRIGVTGMLAYLTSHIHVLIRSYKIRRYSTDKFKAMIAEILALGIMTNLVYSITYSLSSVGGAIWGVAIAVIYTPVKPVRCVQSGNPRLFDHEYIKTEIK